MNDEEIFELIEEKTTRERGYSLLVKEYKEKIYWQIRRMVLSHDDANDLTQDVFIKIYQNLDSFKKDSSLSTWIYRITLNHSINFLNNKKRRLMLGFSSLENKMIDNLKSDPLFDSDEAELKLQKAILSLPTKQRAIFNLRYYDEMPFEEMSKILYTSQSALKSSYHFAAKKIQESLLKEDNIKFNLDN